MPIISKHPINYTTWELVSQVYNKFASDKVTVIDTMWTEPEDLSALVETALEQNHKVVVMNWLDELRGEFRDPLFSNNDVMVVENLWPLLTTASKLSLSVAVS